MIAEVPLLERTPPHSEEAEKGVVCSILLKPDVLDDLSSLRPNDFHLPSVRSLYTAMLALRAADKPIDLALLIDHLKASGDFDAIGGTPFLIDVAESEASPVNAAYYAGIIKQRAAARAVIHTSLHNLRDAYSGDDAGGLIGRTEQRLRDTLDDSDGEAVALSAAMVETMDGVNERILHGVPSGLTSGLTTGLTDVDKLLGGLRPGEFIILAGRPASGKTSAALNIIEHVANQLKTGVLIVSLEMSRRELCERLLSSRTGINGNRIRDGQLNGDDRRQLIEAQIAFEELPIFIDDTPRRTIAEVAAQARRLQRRGKLGLLAIDYLSLIEPENSRDPRQEQVAKMARRLKTLARELRVPILCLAQLNRDVEKGNEHRPKLAHLRESGAIEQDADVVLFVHREEVYKPDDRDLKGKAEIIIGKNRNGETGIVPVAWNGATTTFKNAVRGQEWNPDA